MEIFIITTLEICYKLLEVMRESSCVLLSKEQMVRIPYQQNENDQEKDIYDYTKMLLSDAELVKEVRDRGPIGDYYIEGMDSAMKNAQLYFDLNGSVKK